MKKGTKVPFFYISSSIIPNMAHQINTLGLKSHTVVKSCAVSKIKSFVTLRSFSISI